MITINLQDSIPVDYTQTVLLKLEEMESMIEQAKADAIKECPYDLEHVLYNIKRILRETTEMVNNAADYYEVASEPIPKKENIVLTKPLESRT